MKLTLTMFILIPLLSSTAFSEDFRGASTSDFGTTQGMSISIGQENLDSTNSESYPFFIESKESIDPSSTVFFKDFWVAPTSDDDTTRDWNMPIGQENLDSTSSESYPIFIDPYRISKDLQPAPPIENKLPPFPVETTTNHNNKSSYPVINGTNQYYPKILTKDTEIWEKPTIRNFDSFRKGCPNCIIIPKDPNNLVETDDEGKPNQCPYCLDITDIVKKMEVPGGPGVTSVPTMPPSLSRPVFLKSVRSIYLNPDEFNKSFDNNPDSCKLPSNFKSLGVELYKRIVEKLSNQSEKLAEFMRNLPTNCPKGLLAYLLKKNKEIT